MGGGGGGGWMKKIGDSSCGGREWIWREGEEYGVVLWEGLEVGWFQPGKLYYLLLCTRD